MSEAPTPAGGWVPKCLLGAFGDNGDVYCRACVEADRILQKRLEMPYEDEFALKIIADDEGLEGLELVPGREVVPFISVQGIRCMNCEQRIEVNPEGT